jgi:hypothetical protein
MSRAQVTMLILIIGIYLGAYFLSTKGLLNNNKFTHLRRICYISYGSILLLLNTLYFFCTPLMGQRIWITCREAASPVACDVEAESATSIVVGNVAQSIAIAMSDALLVSFTLFCSLLLLNLLTLIRYTDAISSLDQDYTS